MARPCHYSAPSGSPARDLNMSAFDFIAILSEYCNAPLTGLTRIRNNQLQLICVYVIFWTSEQGISFLIHLCIFRLYTCLTCLSVTVGNGQRFEVLHFVYFLDNLKLDKNTRPIYCVSRCDVSTIPFWRIAISKAEISKRSQCGDVNHFIYFR